VVLTKFSTVLATSLIIPEMPLLISIAPLKIFGADSCAIPEISLPISIAPRRISGADSCATSAALLLLNFEITRDEI